MGTRGSRLSGSVLERLRRIGMIVVLILFNGTVSAPGYGFVAPGEHAVVIYRTDFSLYPFIRIYLRTFDDKMQPLPDLNEYNVLLMIRGRPYDPRKKQFGIQSMRGRREATRSVLVIDASQSMGHKTEGVESQALRSKAHTPFEEMLRAAVRFIEGKRPQDEVAVLLVRDTKEGYAVVSRFERDGRALARRLAAMRADGLKTRLYDAIDAALRMCGTNSEDSNSVVSCSVLVMSDGKDEGSAITREDLMTRIAALPSPYPIYSLAYSPTNRTHFKNLEALSKNSLGIYYRVGERPSGMRPILAEIRNLLHSDYVVTLRSYLPADGARHDIAVGVEAPRGSGNYAFDNSFFKAIRQPFTREVEEAKLLLAKKIEKLPDGAEPYYY
ncbi:vWA domain-containing protein [Candidatus Thiosymbion oneisti]|uniref:vWA domain-containing protein n=1 Tax=Candidatus Thiosymbion oneisti TaxID=589554 RepID=UPI000A44D7D2|nr:VWA domain-containing protein [Candidatus Thiosymbion oneisti]